MQWNNSTQNKCEKFVIIIISFTATGDDPFMGDDPHDSSDAAAIIGMLGPSLVWVMLCYNNCYSGQ